MEGGGGPPAVDAGPEGEAHGYQRPRMPPAVVPLASTRPTRIGSSRWRTRMRYTLTNAGPKPVTVDLLQSGLWGDTRIVDESQKSERLSADEARWRVTVPANGEATVSATFDSRY